MKNTDLVIDAKNLTKSYGKNQVLNGIDLAIQRGSMLALLGPNGAGKTTIVRILSTLLKPDGGSAIIEGFNLLSEPNKVRGVIGLTGQSAAVDELLTGRENLVMMGRLYRLTKRSATLRADELLKDFDLVGAANRVAKTYSGGMRRRLDLAVSLIAAPPIIFLDEPTTGLDPRSRLAMWNIIKNLLSSGTTILLTTQYLDEADQLADEIVVIDGGKVIAKGTATELKSKVGKDRLGLSFSNSDSFRSAKVALGSRVSESSEKELTITVIINDTNSDVKEILNSLADNKIDIVSMDVHKPTLDDVFLSLTGKQKSNQEQAD